jgi:Putative MetA-pathway of phenol degradation
MIIPFAFSLTDATGVGLMTQYDLVSEEAGSGYDIQFVNSATVGTDLTDELGGYAEIWNASASGERSQTTLDFGVTYAYDENTQFDMGLNIGVSDAADDLNPFLGISQRF